MENHSSARALEDAGFSREGVLPRFSVHPNISSAPRYCYAYAVTRSPLKEAAAALSVICFIRGVPQRSTLADLLPDRLLGAILFETRLKLGAERLIRGQEGERF